MLTTLATALLLPASAQTTAELVAIRVGRAETIQQGPIEHAVLLVENGKIVAIGEDLPVERGIRVLELPDWVAMPGLVDCYSRIGMSGEAGDSFDPHLRASRELDPRQDLWRDLLEAGVTTLGLYPPGNGIPGQAVAVKPVGESEEEMVLADDVYLKIVLRSSPSSKKQLREAFEKVDEYDEKVAKAREKWEKDQEKAKKKKPKKDDEKEEDKEEKQEEGEAEGPKDFVPPEPDEKVKPFLALREGRLSAVVEIRKAADYLHLLDVIEKEDFQWSLRCPLRDDIDFFHIADRLGERKVSVIFEPEITLQPNSRRERNIPAEVQRAGAKVVFVPQRDDVRGHERWLKDVGLMVAAGLDRQAALAAVTLEPARVLRLDERLGSLEKGKDANIVFWNGDPLEPWTRVQAVMLEGRIVHGEVDQ
jgi:imidazolonepropionase-like amidohydrolase